MSEVASSYISLEELKLSLAIKSDETRHDTKLLDILQDARVEIDMEIKPYVDDVPLPPGTDVFYHASKCALYYAKAHWFEHVFQLDKARYNHEMYEKKLEKLTDSIKSDKPDRTEAAFVQGDDPLTDKVFPTSQVDQYITREFY